MPDSTPSTRTPAPSRDAPTDIEGALHLALSSSSGTVVTDIIIHEGQAIRAKSARGTLPLHQLFPGIAPFAVTRAHIAAYLAPLDGDHAAAAMTAGRETRIDPELARQHPLCFRIDGPGGASLRCSLFLRNTGELALVMRVSPGTITTDFHSRYSSAEKLEATRKTIPLQRLGTAEDCAPAYLFLASKALSGYITGQVLEVNGGQLIC